MTCAEWAQWAEAVGTFLAVVTALVIALFQDRLRERVWRPVLDVSVEAAPPDCLKIPMTGRGPAGELVAVADCCYLRLRVSNRGNRQAESVEVFAGGLSRRQADDTFKEVGSFLPMNLLWADYHKVFFPAISPGMYRHCDLAHMIQPEKRAAFSGEDKQWPGVPPTKTILSLDTAVKPNTLSHLQPHGQYRMDIVVAAANAKPIKRTLEITLTGDWYDNESQMLSQGVGVRVLS